jgi:hypothetical protein
MLEALRQKLQAELGNGSAAGSSDGGGAALNERWKIATLANELLDGLEQERRRQEQEEKEEEDEEEDEEQEEQGRRRGQMGSQARSAPLPAQAQAPQRSDLSTVVSRKAALATPSAAGSLNTTGRPTPAAGFSPAATGPPRAAAAVTGQPPVSTIVAALGHADSSLGPGSGNWLIATSPHMANSCDSMNDTLGRRATDDTDAQTLGPEDSHVQLPGSGARPRAAEGLPPRSARLAGEAGQWAQPEPADESPRSVGRLGRAALVDSLDLAGFDLLHSEERSVRARQRPACLPPPAAACIAVRVHTPGPGLQASPAC